MLTSKQYDKHPESQPFGLPESVRRRNRKETLQTFHSAVSETSSTVIETILARHAAFRNAMLDRTAATPKSAVVDLTIHARGLGDPLIPPDSANVARFCIAHSFSFLTLTSSPNDG
jgi:hypothetical protein